MDVCVVIRKRAGATTSIVHAKESGDVIVTPSPGLHGKHRRYALNTTIHDPQQWIQDQGKRVRDGVMRGQEMCVFTLGQKGTDKRAWMFNSQTGVLVMWLRNLVQACEVTGGGVEWDMSLWCIEDDVRMELLTAEGDKRVRRDVDVPKLLKRMEGRETLMEGRGHVFCEVSVRNAALDRVGRVWFVDVADVPHLKGNGKLSFPKEDESRPSWHRSSGTSRFCYKELMQFNRMISAMAKSGMYDLAWRMEGKETVFVQEMQRLFERCVVFGVCFVSDHASDYVNTIQTLRTATVLSRIPPPKTTISMAHSAMQLQQSVSCPMTVVSSRSASQMTLPEGFCSSGIAEFDQERQQDHLDSRSDEKSLQFQRESPFDWKKLAEEPDLQSCQSLNTTLLNLLDKQKRMQHHLEHCLEDIKNEKREMLLQKEVEVQDIKIEADVLKSKCHQLQSQSPYSIQFDAYETETHTLLHQMHNLKERNAWLTAQLADLELQQKDGMQTRQTPKRATASLKKLEAEIASLKKENLELHHKARCYDFFKRQCGLLMAEIKSLKSHPVASTRNARR